MFWLFTGKPGTGKTSNAIDFVLHDKRFNVEGSDAKRPVYYRGIRDLKLDWIELSDDEVKNWPDHLPDGAVLVADEAQQIWPGRPASKPVPFGLTAVETHRHHGWDLIFISQDPSLLDTHARKLCNEQYHFSRPFGAPFVIEYHSGSGYVNPATKSELEGCVKTKKRLPKRVWGHYHSAEVHTHKFKPPKILFLVPVLIAFTVFMVWRFYTNYGTHPEEEPTGSGGDSSPQQVVQAEPPPPENWGDLLAPEVPGLPYTAPIYRQQARRAVSVPVVQGCMSMESDFSDCTCYTQQGTTIADMPWQMCRRILKNGMFNHLAREERESTRGGRGADGDAVATASARPVAKNSSHF